MDLKTFEFPEVNGADAVFPTFRTIPELLEEAKERGFYNGNTEYNRLFSQLFFEGGKIEFKKDVDEEFKAKAWPYLRSFMGSFEPKHEEKDAICAMLMSELLVAPKKKKLW
jgi:hypothetical protein